MKLRPFWSDYGSKYNLAPKYPKPVHGTIMEPFAGSACYSLHYSDRNVVLIDKNPQVTELWRYLIAASARDIRGIPVVSTPDELPQSLPAGAKLLVGWSMGRCSVRPQRKITSAAIHSGSAWSVSRRDFIAHQVDHIRHWRVVDGDCTSAPDVCATWFIDPPYSGPAGKYYPFGRNGIDYTALGSWCRDRVGQVIVCEGHGSDWLPFVPFATTRGMRNCPGTNSKAITGEAVLCWHNTLCDEAEAS